MRKNVGTIDRGLRILIGLGLIGAAFLYPNLGPSSYWGSLIIGTMMLGTSAMGWCPPYMLLGINTGAKKD
ncbi:MAG: DUF2892 domain-containing protein [Rhodospirillaceae bacterium]|nr:DUF2892 domain-containing protein [Rhodospirillaceae bacterium]